MRNLLGANKVGVDIGSGAVRVVELSKVDADGYVHIRNAASITLDTEAVVAGRIRQQVIVGQALAAAVSEAGVPRSGMVLGATTSVAAVKAHRLSAELAPSEREKVLRNSQVAISPMIKTEDAELALTMIRHASATENQAAGVIMNIAAIPKDELQTLQTVCRLAGVNPRVIDLPASALFRSMVRINPGEPETLISTIVDIGATKILVATREGSHLRSLRLVPGGGLEVTRALMGLMVEGDVHDPAEAAARFAAAEAQKARMRVDLSGPTPIDLLGPSLAQTSQHQTEIERVFNEQASNIVEKVARAVAADAEANGRRYTQGVHLVGAGARLRGLSDALQDRLSVPVRLTSPWVRGVERLPEGTRAEDYATAIGLALWRPQR